MLFGQLWFPTFRRQVLAPPWQHPHRLMSSGEAAASSGCRHEKITLTAVTTTPRARSLSASYLRERPPVGELPPARRKRLKAESSARSRAMRRLYPEKHAQYKAAERARKTPASGEAALQHGPWQQKARDRIKAERSAWCEAKRQRECDESIALCIAEREAQGWKRVCHGPPNWCDTGGWIWAGRDGRISDVSRIQCDDGSETWTSTLWRANGAHLCGICACDECGVTQHPCACEHPDPSRADWGPVPILWATDRWLRERGYVEGRAGMSLWATPR